MKDLKSVSSDNIDVARLQSNLDNWAKSVRMAGLNDGNLLQNIMLTSGATTLVEHKLNRVPRGYIVVRTRAQSTIWDSQDDNIFKTKSLALECSANVVVDLWIF